MWSGQSDHDLTLEQAAKDAGTNLFEADFHSFIVKIWIEETAEEAGRATWRGHITHVPSGKRCYIQELSGIMAFIAPYLEEMGVEFRRRWPVKQWLKRLELH